MQKCIRECSHNWPNQKKCQNEIRDEGAIFGKYSQMQSLNPYFVPDLISSNGPLKHCGVEFTPRKRYFGACLHRAIINTRMSRQTCVLRHHAACLHGPMIINPAFYGIIILPGQAGQ